MHKPEVTGRMLKWAIELGQFDLEYKSRTAIKGQALADFILEFPPDMEGYDKAIVVANPKGTSQPIPSRGRNIRVMVDNVRGWSGE